MIQHDAHVKHELGLSKKAIHEVIAHIRFEQTE